MSSNEDEAEIEREKNSPLLSLNNHKPSFFFNPKLPNTLKRSKILKNTRKTTKNLESLTHHC
jgi:hypothetical protein